jgi:opacity protein-like surface antigen
MKKLLVTALFAVMPSFAYAQTGYIEGSVGFVLFPDIQSDNYIIDTNGVSPGGVFAGNAETDYGGNWGAGLEVGYQTGPWRFGVSWDWIDAEVDHARLEGTLDGVPFSAEVSDQQLANYGIGANNSVNIFALNAYYVFNSVRPGALIFSGFQPYAGIGVGAATINNASTEFTFLATLGANYAFSSGVYLGARYRLGLISAPTTDNGLKLDSITTHIFSIVLGYRFGV